MLSVGSVKALLASGPLIIQQSHGQRLDHRLHAGRFVSSQEWLDHKTCRLFAGWPDKIQPEHDVRLRGFQWAKIRGTCYKQTDAFG